MSLPGPGPGPLVDVAQAEQLLASGPVRVLEVRWQLGRHDGHDVYLTGHLPGGVYVDLDTELAAPPSAAAGRHPLPEAGRLQASARRWGVHAGTPVLVVDDTGGLAAARAWWLLRWAGLDDVRVLDGGFPAWRAAGRPVATDDVVPAVGDVVLVPGSLPVLDADTAAAWAARGRLVDARAGVRYRGEEEPVDPRAGHVPGALSAPTTDNLGPDGRFRPPDELRARFAALGVPDGEVGVYCGSGVTAAHEALALTLAGRQPVVYPGSWSAWSGDPSRPVVTGPLP